MNRYGRLGACAALVACLFLAGCQSQKPPEGVRVYERQELEHGDALISVEGTSATVPEASEAAGGFGAAEDSVINESPPEGSELLTIVATLKNVGPAAFWTTAGHEMPEIVDSAGTRLQIAEDWYTFAGQLGEPESGPRDGESYLLPGGTVVAIASFFVPKDEPGLRFTWLVAAGDSVEFSLTGY